MAMMAKRKSVELRVPQFLPGRCRRDSKGIAQARSSRADLGKHRTGRVRNRPLRDVPVQLALHRLYFLPFFYLGHCFSYLNGYYRHYGANPDKPIAWGVSSYGKIYNWLFFYNGYHAEHHFRPKVHWTKMEAFRRQSPNCRSRKACA